MTPIPEQVLARAAMELLASSGIRRYTAQARILAREAFPAVQSGEVVTHQAMMKRLVECVQRQASRDTREVEEIEAALLLARLIDTHVEEGEQLLRELQAATHPGLRWLSGMADILLRERAATSPVTVLPSVVPDLHTPESTTDGGQLFSIAA